MEASRTNHDWLNFALFSCDQARKAAHHLLLALASAWWSRRVERPRTPKGFTLSTSDVGLNDLPVSRLQ